MHSIKISWTFIIAVILFNSALFGQIQSYNRIVIMPFISEGIDNTTIKSAETILRQEITKLGITDVVSGPAVNSEINDTSCLSLDCEIKYGEKFNASKVVVCNLLVLGKKTIIQYSVVDVKLKKVLIYDSITSLTIEELDVIMKRIALSVINIETTNQTAKVGTITGNESTKLLLRSGGGYYGFSFGYLYPGSGYGNAERSFTMDFRTGVEIEKFEYGLQLFARNGFGADLYSSYLFSQYDICPYIGGGLGFHWVSFTENTYYNTYGYSYMQSEVKKGDGFELLLNSGVRLFNTYSFRLTINLSYSHTFNDYGSDGIALTIGFLH